MVAQRGSDQAVDNLTHLENQTSEVVKLAKVQHEETAKKLHEIRQTNANLRSELEDHQNMVDELQSLLSSSY